MGPYNQGQLENGIHALVAHEGERNACAHRYDEVERADDVEDEVVQLGVSKQKDR